MPYYLREICIMCCHTCLCGDLLGTDIMPSLRTLTLQNDKPLLFTIVMSIG